jgi:simple sugar transport system permease protein
MDSLTTFLASMMRLTAPLAFSASGEYVAERGGTLNISLEGMMLSGAFFGIWGSDAFNSVPLGLLCGMLAGLAVAFIHAQMAHRLQANTFVVGLTLNILALGLTSYLFQTIEPKGVQADIISIPGLHNIPVIGEPLFENRWPFYLLLIVVPLAWFIVARTRWGLELRACGEDPAAADGNRSTASVPRN